MSRSPRIAAAALAAACLIVPAPAGAQLGLPDLGLDLPELTSEITGSFAGDTLVAKAVGSLVYGSGGSDTIKGGPAADQLYGETGADKVFGNGGADLVHGGSADDVLEGGDGNDHILGDFGLDEIRGGAGDDVIDAGGATDKVDGGPGDDTIHMGGSNDFVHGGAGNDTIHTTSGSDSVWAEDGNDTIFINNGTGIREVRCGAGFDTLHINPRQGPGGWSSMDAIRDGRVSECERIVETPVPVDPDAGISWERELKGGTTHGSPRNDKLLGGHGSDRIFGGDGDDLLWGDKLSYVKSRKAYRARDLLSAGAGNDTVYGGRGFNRMRGGRGDDYLQGGEGRNAVAGGAGDDTVRLRSGKGGRVTGGAGNDTIIAVVLRGKVRVRCGAGKDLVQISRWRTGRRLVKVARDCERVKRG